MSNESFERALEPQYLKRKRSSILKLPEKRISRDRDSRTVSFNDRFTYKELHQDGTCDITKLFLRQDQEMDITTLDVVQPATYDNNQMLDQTINDSIDMSIEQSQSNATQNFDDCSMDMTLVSQFIASMPKIPDLGKSDYDCSTIYEKPMSISNVSQIPPDTPQKHPDTSQEAPNNSHKAPDTSQEAPDTSHEMSDPSQEAPDTPQIPPSSSCSSPASSNDESTLKHEESTLRNASLTQDNLTITQEFNATTRNDTTMINNCSYGISDVSSIDSRIYAPKSVNETFTELNSIQSSAVSGIDTLLNNLEALNNCIEEVDQKTDERRIMLDNEIEELLKFYRHIVNKDNKYEFAIKIFGLRYCLWLIFNINPETYPDEKLNIRFAVNKDDRHMYPFAEFSEAVRRYTKKGNSDYLTKLVINAQKFRRFLKKIDYAKMNK